MRLGWDPGSYNNLYSSSSPFAIDFTSKRFVRSVNIWRSSNSVQHVFSVFGTTFNIWDTLAIHYSSRSTVSCYRYAGGVWWPASWRWAVPGICSELVLRLKAQTLLRIYLRRLRWKRQQVRVISIVHGILCTANWLIYSLSSAACWPGVVWSHPLPTLSRFIFTVRPHAGPDLRTACLR